MHTLVTCRRCNWRCTGERAGAKSVMAEHLRHEHPMLAKSYRLMDPHDARSSRIHPQRVPTEWQSPSMGAARTIRLNNAHLEHDYRRTP